MDPHSYVGLTGKTTEMGGVHWSEEATSTLKTLWGTMPASWVAKRMGITKGMVIGKADRLGLRAVSAGAMWSIIRRERTPYPVVRPPSRPRKPRKVKPMQFPEPEMKLISIVDLNDTTCHWPVGDPSDWDNFRYCGLCKRTEDKSPYCSYHYTKSMKQFEAVFA
jgi:GcrA cell cycle regulator